MPDEDINTSFLRKVTLHVNASNAESKTLEHIPKYPEIRLDTNQTDKKRKVTAFEENNGSRPRPKSSQYNTPGKSCVVVGV